MAAVPLPLRNTDIPTTAPEPSASAAAITALPHDLPALATAAGAAVGSAAKAIGNGQGGGPNQLAAGFVIAAAIGTGLWFHTRVTQAEDATRAAAEKLSTFDARMMRIELALEKHAEAAEALPEIRRQLDRLIEDQRSTAGSIATLERLIRGEPEEKTP